MQEDFVADGTHDRATDLVVDLLKQQEEKALKEILHEKDEEVELTDSELMQVLNLYTELTEKYFHQPGHYANYKSLSQEFRDRFEEIGLIVQVDYIIKGLAIDPDASPVEVAIVARCNPIDRDRQYDEVRAGVADSYYDKHRRN